MTPPNTNKFQHYKLIRLCFSWMVQKSLSAVQQLPNSSNIVFVFSQGRIRTRHGLVPASEPPFGLFGVSRWWWWGWGAVIALRSALSSSVRIAPVTAPDPNHLYSLFRFDQLYRFCLWLFTFEIIGEWLLLINISSIVVLTMSLVNLPVFHCWSNNRTDNEHVFHCCEFCPLFSYS